MHQRPRFEFGDVTTGAATGYTSLPGGQSSSPRAGIAQMQAPTVSAGMVTRDTSLDSFSLLHVKVLPFFALFQHKGFGVFERFEEAFPLDDIARLTTGDEVIHLSCPAVRVRVNMVNRKDHPV